MPCSSRGPITSLNNEASRRIGFRQLHGKSAREVGKAPTHRTSCFKALASPSRRRILDALRGGTQTPGSPCTLIPKLDRTTVLQYLRVLERAELVTGRKWGASATSHLHPSRLSASTIAGSAITWMLPSIFLRSYRAITRPDLARQEGAYDAQTMSFLYPRRCAA